jgi:hypothetical protein
MNLNDMPQSGALVATVFRDLCCLSNRSANSCKLTALGGAPEGIPTSAADAILEK